MTSRQTRRGLCLLVLAVAMPGSTRAQDRLKTYPGYEHIARMAPQIIEAAMSILVPPGELAVEWLDGGKVVQYGFGGKFYRYDVSSKEMLAVTPPSEPPRNEAPARATLGNQFTDAYAPDSSRRAFYRDRNLWLSDREGGSELAVTSEGSEADRTKFGNASWAYGEELDQNTAMWWSPSGERLAYYGFDEKLVPDYYLQLDQLKVQSRMGVEAYPKAGGQNAVVDVYVYDVASSRRTKLDTRMGQPFSNDVIGHYTYGVAWTPDGSEVTLNRTNRRQNIMEFTACSPDSGRCRVIVREEWLPSWTANSPDMQYLADGKRFIWLSERTGFRNLYLYNLEGKLLTPLTKHAFEVEQVVKVDEKAGLLWYTALSGDNHMKSQLHRVGLDGQGDRRITDPALHHQVSLSPDGKLIVDVVQLHDRAPVMRLLDGDGRFVAELAKPDLSRFEQLGVQSTELFTFTSADGHTQLHGLLERPSNFDPSRKYPLLVAVYGGPRTSEATEEYSPSILAEYGFLVLRLDARSAGGRGKHFLDAIYQKLGIIEVDDFAAGVKAVRTRPYVDGSRVGVMGVSYGGYTAAMALLRYPDVFHAAVAMSPVTSWKHYDTIYTERYMWLPQENAAGYEAGSAMTYVADLRGRLMLYYGTADDNVHPAHSMELIKALQQAGKSFELQVGPDAGHGAMNYQRAMEFLIENLVLAGPAK